MEKLSAECTLGVPSANGADWDVVVTINPATGWTINDLVNNCILVNDNTGSLELHRWKATAVGAPSGDSATVTFTYADEKVEPASGPNRFYTSFIMNPVDDTDSILAYVDYASKLGLPLAFVYYGFNENYRSLDTFLDTANAHIANTNNPHSTVADDVLPTQAGHTGEYLTTNGTTSSWAAVSGGYPDAFDAVVDANGAGDYTTLDAAFTAGHKRLYVAPGTYPTTHQFEPAEGDFYEIYHAGNPEDVVIQLDSDNFGTPDWWWEETNLTAYSDSNPATYDYTEGSQDITLASGTFSTVAPWLNVGDKIIFTLFGDKRHAMFGNECGIGVFEVEAITGDNVLTLDRPLPAYSFTGVGLYFREYLDPAVTTKFLCEGVTLDCNSTTVSKGRLFEIGWDKWFNYRFKRCNLKFTNWDEIDGTDHLTHFSEYIDCDFFSLQDIAVQPFEIQMYNGVRLHRCNFYGAENNTRFRLPGDSQTGGVDVEGCYFEHMLLRDVFTELKGTTTVLKEGVRLFRWVNNTFGPRVEYPDDFTGAHIVDGKGVRVDLYGDVHGNRGHLYSTSVTDALNGTPMRLEVILPEMVAGWGADFRVPDGYTLTPDETSVRSLRQIIDLIKIGASTDKLAVTTTTGTVLQNHAYAFVSPTTAAAPVTVTVNTARLSSPDPLVIKDIEGGAATNNITIATEGAETIDGQTTVNLNVNYGAITLVSDGTNWSIV